MFDGRSRDPLRIAHEERDLNTAQPLAPGQVPRRANNSIDRRRGAESLTSRTRRKTQTSALATAAPEDYGALPDKRIVAGGNARLHHRTPANRGSKQRAYLFS